MQWQDTYVITERTIDDFFEIKENLTVELNSVVQIIFVYIDKRLFSLPFCTIRLKGEKIYICRLSNIYF